MNPRIDIVTIQIEQIRGTGVSIAGPAASSDLGRTQVGSGGWLSPGGYFLLFTKAGCQHFGINASRPQAVDQDRLRNVGSGRCSNNGQDLLRAAHDQEHLPKPCTLACLFSRVIRESSEAPGALFWSSCSSSQAYASGWSVA